MIFKVIVLDFWQQKIRMFSNVKDARFTSVHFLNNDEYSLFLSVDLLSI